MSEAAPASSPGQPPATLAYHTSTGAIPDGWTHTTIHALRPDLIHLEWHRVLTLIYSITLPVSLCGIAAMLWGMRGNRQGMLIILIVMPPLMAGLMALRIYRTRRQFDVRWPTFRLLVADQGIVRSRAELPDLLIHADEIRDLREMSSGILLRGSRRVDLVLIPRCLESYDTVRERFAAMHPLVQGRSWIRFKAFAGMLLLFGGFTLGLQARSPAFQWVIAAFLTALAVWTVTQNLRSPNLTSRQKLGALFVLFFPGMLILFLILPHLGRMFFP